MLLKERLIHRINQKTKPPGSLGMLEEIALQLGLIQETASPVICAPHIVVFAGDHGITSTGLVNPYPQAVTAQMVLNFVRGGAAINVFTRQHGIGLTVVDAGVNKDLSAINHPSFIHAKQGWGTENYLEKPAMRLEQCQDAILEGKKIVASIAKTGTNCIGFGEMGIGNTSAATLIMSAITGIPVRECTGRGTGVSDTQLATKTSTLEQVFAQYQLATLKNDPIALLAMVGGFEIAMMTGAYLQAAAEKMVIVVDGFIASAALMIATSMVPSILNNCIFAHQSGEKGHTQMLAHFKAKPLLQLGCRLGEGTGAALAIPLLQSAALFLAEMASFESAGVTDRTSE